MNEHIEDSLVLKEIPPFVSKFFVEQDGGKIVALAPSTTEQKTNAKPAATTKGGKRKLDGTNPAPNKKKRGTSNKSLTMGIFHVKKGTPVSKALPNKSKLKDGASICFDFCCHKRKCKYPHQLCTNGKHYTNWKNVPEAYKLVLLSHMDSTGLLWFNEETMKKYRIKIAPEFAHLLSDASGPKPKQTKST
jgi:hypothetical protein